MGFWLCRVNDSESSPVIFARWIRGIESILSSTKRSGGVQKYARSINQRHSIYSSRTICSEDINR